MVGFQYVAAGHASTSARPKYVAAGPNYASTGPLRTPRTALRAVFHGIPSKLSRFLANAFSSPNLFFVVRTCFFQARETSSRVLHGCALGAPRVFPAILVYSLAGETPGKQVGKTHWPGKHPGNKLKKHIGPGNKLGKQGFPLKNSLFASLLAPRF